MNKSQLSEKEISERSQKFYNRVGKVEKKIAQFAPT